MPETNDTKSRWKDVFIALKHLFKTPEEKKKLDQATVEKELAEFTKINGYDVDDPDFDIEGFKNKFIEYLKNKNYDFAGVNASLIPVDDSEKTDGELVINSLKKVRKVTENLNDNVRALSVFVDTRKMMPGLVCYVIEKVVPTQKKPYVTYRPTPRVITQVHDSGVNGGTIFFTYNHKIATNQSFNGISYTVSENEVIYSPLTKEHADYICRLLNIQSKQVYVKHMKEMAKKKQLQHVK